MARTHEVGTYELLLLEKRKCLVSSMAENGQWRKTATAKNRNIYITALRNIKKKLYTLVLEFSECGEE